MTSYGTIANNSGWFARGNGTFAAGRMPAGRGYAYDTQSLSFSRPCAVV